MMGVEAPAQSDEESSGSPVYSLVRIREVAYAGDDSNPIPEHIVQGGAPPPIVDPEGIVGGTRDGFLIGIHATDPPVGTGDTSLRSLIGLTVRPTGEFEDVPVPIIPNLTEIQDGQTMPPKPENDGAILVAKVWRFTRGDRVPVPRPVTVDGDALQAQAEMAGGLNRNPDVPTFVFSGPNLTPSEGTNTQ